MAVKHLLSSSSLIAAVILGTTQVTYASDFNSELNSLLKNHPLLKERALSTQAAGDDLKAAKAAFYPRLDFSGGYGVERASKPRSRQPNGAKTLERHDQELRLTYNLFNGYEDEARKKVALTQQTLTRNETNDSEQRLLFEGASAYLRVWQTNRLLNLAQRNESNVASQLKLEKSRVEKGTGVQVDALLAQARLQVARESRVAIEGLFATAKANYQALFNKLPKINQMEGTKAPKSKLPNNLESAKQSARKSHPAMRIAQRRIELAEHRQTIEHSEFLPKIDLLGSALRENDIDGARGTEHTYSAQIRMRVNLYAGGANLARESAAKARASAARAGLARVARAVDEEADNAWQDYETTGNRRELLDEAVKIAEQVYTARKKMRDAGRETAINVLNAESELFQTQIKLVGADFAHRVAGFRLLRAMGVLNKETLGL